MKTINPLVQKLLDGNILYKDCKSPINNNHSNRRIVTATQGQKPFAVIITCSDSRVVPEFIFSCDIGDLFVIRVAGNVIGEYELASIEYAVDHLKCQLVVVMGHTQCGAIDSTLKNSSGTFVDSLLRPIRYAIVKEKDPNKAAILNAKFGVNEIQNRLNRKIEVIAMLYDIATGEVKIV